MDSARHEIDLGWRALADEPAAPPRPLPVVSSCAPPPRTAVTRRRSITPPPPPSDDVPLTALLPRARGWRLLTPVPQMMPDDQLNRWRASERRLWQIAGSLMALALLVVGALALLTFSPSAPPAHAAAAPAAAPALPSAPATASAPASRAAASPPAARHRVKSAKRARARKLAHK